MSDPIVGVPSARGVGESVQRAQGVDDKISPGGLTLHD